MRPFGMTLMFSVFAWAGCGVDSNPTISNDSSTLDARAPYSVPPEIVYGDHERSSNDALELAPSVQDQLDGRLQNSWSKKCLAVTPKSGNLVTQEFCDGSPTLFLRQRPIGEGAVQLVLGSNDTCLQVKGKSPGEKVQMKKCSKSKAQQFSLDRISPNRVRFLSSKNGLCLIVPYDGVIAQQTCSGRTDVQEFGPVEVPPEKPSPEKLAEKWVRETHEVIQDGDKIILIPKLAPAQNTQSILGLLVLVDFSDMEFTSSVFDAAIRINHDLRGYSIYQKNIDLQHVVIGNMRSSKPYTYFMDPNHPEKENEYVRSRELIRELFTKLNSISKFDFSTLSVHNRWTPDYVVHSFMMLFAADANSGRAGWARGLWPVSGWERGKVFQTAFAHYQQSGIIQSSKNFQMGTIIHETGHQVMELGEDQGDWGNGNWDSWCSQHCFR